MLSAQTQLSRPRGSEQSATELLKEMYEEQKQLSKEYGNRIENQKTEIVFIKLNMK